VVLVVERVRVELRSFERAEDDGYCEKKCRKNGIDIRSYVPKKSQEEVLLPICV